MCFVMESLWLVVVGQCRILVVHCEHFFESLVSYGIIVKFFRSLWLVRDHSLFLAGDWLVISIIYQIENLDPLVIKTKSSCPPPQKKEINKKLANLVPAAWFAGTEQGMSRIVGTTLSRYRDCYLY